MRRIVLLIALAMMVSGSVFAVQETGTNVFFGNNLVAFEPIPANVNDLDHSYAYTWGINYDLPQGTSVYSASLTFNQINNWQDEDNILYMNLLNDAAYGVTSDYDGEASGNYFEGSGTFLTSYTDGDASTPVDFTWNFTSPQVAALNAALANGNFGIGFDPDCHYWNNGVKLTLNTNVVPEPFSALLFVSGAGALAFLRKRRIG